MRARAAAGCCRWRRCGGVAESPSEVPPYECDPRRCLPVRMPSAPMKRRGVRARACGRGVLPVAAVWRRGGISFGGSALRMRSSPVPARSDAECADEEARRSCASVLPRGAAWWRRCGGGAESPSEVPPYECDPRRRLPVRMPSAPMKRRGVRVRACGHRAARWRRYSKLPTESWERLSKRVYSPKNFSFTEPVGPLRCLPMMTSARPLSGEFSLL